MKCKYCDEGLVVKEVKYLVDDYGKKVPCIEYKVCPCCNGNYERCENCTRQLNA